MENTLSSRVRDVGSIPTWPAKKGVDMKRIKKIIQHRDFWGFVGPAVLFVGIIGGIFLGRYLIMNYPSTTPFVALAGVITCVGLFAAGMAGGYHGP